MDTAYFKACVTKTLDAKSVKDGLRLMARKNPTAFTARSVIGLKSAVGALLYAVEDYTLGMQLNDTIREDASGALADCLYHAVVLGKTLKVTVPGAGKKVKLHGMTLTRALLELDAMTTRMLIDLQRVMEPDAEAAAFDPAPLAEHLREVFKLLWPICTELAQRLPAELMEAEVSKLSGGYPQDFFVIEKKPRVKKTLTEGAAPAPAPAKKVAVKAAAKKVPAAKKAAATKPSASA